MCVELNTGLWEYKMKICKGIAFRFKKKKKEKGSVADVREVN